MATEGNRNTRHERAANQSPIGAGTLLTSIEAARSWIEALAGLRAAGCEHGTGKLRHPLRVT